MFYLICKIKHQVSLW